MSSRQRSSPKTRARLVAHLLCRDCEERINKFGEAPALALINRGNTFPLFNRMRLAAPVWTLDQLATYSGRAMGFDIEALVYYALSLAWRGAVKEWKTLKGQTTTSTLEAHEEPIRQYLAGKATVPGNVFVVLTVCTDDAAQHIVNAPYPVQTPADVYLQIEMFVRGLWFIVLPVTRCRCTSDHFHCSAHQPVRFISRTAPTRY